jgi:hypothetical protein
LTVLQFGSGMSLRGAYIKSFLLSLEILEGGGA